MKKITCEMCGSTDLIKKDGVFECQSCGTKYSVEEAKKMMVEGKVDVSGSTVKVDDSDKIVNYLMMAENAYDSSNQKEAENYCNKIIETEPNNYKAWLLKGKAAGWQSTLGNLRLEEAVSAFNKALDNCPEEDLEAVKEDAGNEIKKMYAGLSDSRLYRRCCSIFSFAGGCQFSTKAAAGEYIDRLHQAVYQYSHAIGTGFHSGLWMGL